MTVRKEHQFCKPHLHKPRILPLLYTLLDKLQGLLQILRVNGILDLFIAPLKNGFIGGRHYSDLCAGGNAALWMQPIHHSNRETRDNSSKRIRMLRQSTAHVCKRYLGDRMKEGKEAIEFAILNSCFGGEFAKAVVADVRRTVDFV